MSYESEALRNTYLLFHYGSHQEILDAAGFDPQLIPAEFTEFPVATVDFFKSESETFSRALDLGCAVGRSSFELSKIANEVIGIDFSTSFIEAAESLQSLDSVEILRYFEAHLGESITISAPEDANFDRISFEQGDAMDLRDDLGSFDLVHAANLLCRLPEPLKFLNRLPGLVNPSGQLVMATPCTWLAEYTPQENQPPGQTLDFLKENLGADFELESVREIPFLIREHVRKFQISTSQTSLWRRKS